LSALAAAPAQAVVIDFESLARNDNQIVYVSGGNTPTSVGNTSYTEKGFTITGSLLGTPGSLSPYYSGSTALFDDFFSPLNLSQVGGGVFSISSIDLTTLFNSSTTVSFTGTKANSTTVSQIFTTDAVVNTLQTFNFNSNFTDLVSVNWSGNNLQHDNINVSAASATSVPEPFTVLGTIFGAGYGVALKRKLAKAQADKEDIS
jgi:hypothetical protein